MIKLSQIAVSAFMIYIFWFRDTYGHTPLLLYGTVILATTAALLDLAANRARLPMNKITKMFFTYGAFAFLSGVMISRNQSHFMSMMGTYFAFIIVCWVCFYISYRKHETKWIMNVVLLSCFVCAMQTIFWGYDYKTEVIVTTMGPENNPHVLGFTMLLGVFSLLVDEQKTGKNFVIRLLLILMFVYVILLSGSRKSLLCVCAFLVCWVVNIIKTGKQSTKKKRRTWPALLSVFLVGGYFILTRYVNMESFERLLMLFQDSGAVDTRWQMYLDAFEFWKQSPVWGIGFGQYQIWSDYGVYSHSSYAEILSCTGIVGLLIFFIPIINLIRGIWKRTQGRTNRYDYVMCLIMLVVELILGAGQIYIYGFSYLLCFAYIEMRKNELDKGIRS